MQNRGWIKQRMQGSILEGMGERSLTHNVGVKLKFIFLAIVAIGAWSYPLQAQQSIMNAQLQKLNVDENPHWRADECKACHTRSPQNGNLHLRTSNVDMLCNHCHIEISNHKYIHPSNIKASATMLKRMPKVYRNEIKRNKGIISCTTCHDLPKHCLKPNAGLKHRDPFFLRGGPYASRSDICFNCHDDKAYKRMNPHDQVSKNGKIREERCQICHRTTQGLTEATSDEHVDFNVTDDLAKMCLGCHPWKPHPGGAFSFGNKEPPNHLVIPSIGITRHMRAQVKKNNLKMALDPNTGRVYCATCHNPHAKGVIKNKAAAKGAGSKNRLRTTEICEQCHDK